MNFREENTLFLIKILGSIDGKPFAILPLTLRKLLCSILKILYACVNVCVIKMCIWKKSTYVKIHHYILGRENYTKNIEIP